MVAKYIYGSRHTLISLFVIIIYTNFSVMNQQLTSIFLLEQQFTSESRKEKSVVVIESVSCG
jgi:hypothetical protein